MVEAGYFRARLSEASAHLHCRVCVLTIYISQDPYLKVVADGADVAVISIGYRLAPENPFPQGPQDCFDAAEWLVDNAQSQLGAELKFIGGEVSKHQPGAC